jgi:hypothetical protein
MAGYCSDNNAFLLQYVNKLSQVKEMGSPFYRSLEASKIAVRSEPYYTSACRTTVTLQKYYKRLLIAIKNRLDKSMPPQFTAIAVRTPVRPGPWIITAFYKNILEFGGKKDYQLN